jgi:hypothetical protein
MVGGNELFPPHFNFAPDYVIKKIQRNQDRLRFNILYNSACFSDHAVSFGENIISVNNNKKSLLRSSKESDPASKVVNHLRINQDKSFVGSQSHQTVKYGHESRGTRSQESLCWRGPAAI